MRIKSLALVVAEPFLTRDYPGGVLGFLADQVAVAGPDLCLMRKGNLVVVTDPNPERLVAATDQIDETTDATFGDAPAYVIVDPEEDEPSDIPCHWLSYTRQDDGSAEVSFADKALAKDGRAVAEPTLVRLSEENGRITWLDTETGRQLVSPSLPSVPPADVDALQPMLDAAASMIERRGWRFERDDDGDLRFSLNAGPLLAFDLQFLACSRGDALLLLVRLPGRTSEERIPQVATYLAGANWLLEVGGFEMDLSDGEVMYRAGLPAPNGMLSSAMAEIALDRCMQTVKHYAAGLIEVVSGEDPREVLKRVEGE